MALLIHHGHGRSEFFGERRNVTGPKRQMLEAIAQTINWSERVFSTETGFKRHLGIPMELCELGQRGQQRSAFFRVMTRIRAEKSSRGQLIKSVETIDKKSDRELGWRSGGTRSVNKFGVANKSPTTHPAELLPTVDPSPILTSCAAHLSACVGNLPATIYLHHYANLLRKVG